MDNYGQKLIVLFDNDIQHTFLLIIQMLMTMIILLLVILQIDRLVQIYFGLFLPTLVYPTMTDVLPSPASELDYPLVAVQLPMLNEIECCEAIIDCACNLEWPRNRLFVQVIDDSTLDQAKVIVDRCVQHWASRGVGIGVCRRTNRQGFKAGGLNYGMSFIPHAEYVVLFDADFLPTKDYLLRTVPVLMHDSTVAFVQARWTFTNAKESFLTRMQEIILNFHHKCEQEGRSRASLFFTFNGTGGVWRASAIEQVGGWHTDTLVEDLDLSLRVHLNGWRAVYMKDVECLNELPPTLSAYRSQQHRWTSGPMQVARKMIGTICRTNHISFFKKVACLFYLSRNLTCLLNVISLFVIVPMGLWMPRWNFYVVVNICISIFESCYITAFTSGGIYLAPLYFLFINGMSLHNACALISGLFNYGLAKQWIVTPKVGLANRDVHPMKKTTENVLLESKQNENILVTSTKRDIKKWCFYCLSSILLSISNLFQWRNSRMRQNIFSLPLYKSNFFMGVYLLTISYVAFTKEAYISGVYIVSVAIMYIILAFNWIGRSNKLTSTTDNSLKV